MGHAAVQATRGAGLGLARQHLMMRVPVTHSGGCVGPGPALASHSSWLGVVSPQGTPACTPALLRWQPGLHGYHATPIFEPMIVSFADPTTEALFHGIRDARTRRVPPEVQRTTARKLDMLNAATVLQDLAAPPGNRLEALRGNWKGRHSIRVNDQWRILFRWTASGPADVQLLDYH